MGAISIQIRRAWLCTAVVLGAGHLAVAAKYPLTNFPQLNDVTVLDVTQDSSGLIWLATTNGLWRWFDHEFVAERQRLPAAEPAVCLFANQQVLWVGTADGLTGVDLGTLSPRAGPDGLKGRKVYSLVRDAPGRVWCGTSDGLYSLQLITAPPTAELLDGTGGMEIYSVVVDPRGRVWAGTRGALLSYEDRTLRRHFEEEFAGGEVRGLAVTGTDQIWIGLRNPGGLYVCADGGLTALRPGAEEPPPQVNVIITHPHGEVWIGTERGVLRWTGKAFTRIDREAGLVHESVQSLYVDREDLVWIATRDGGVYLLRSPHIRIYDVYDGLPHPVVQAVLPRPGGEFIVGTAVGMCRMSVTGRVVQTYPYLGSVEVLYAGRDAGLWAGGPHGLACFDERSGERRPVPDAAARQQVNAIGPHEQDGVRVCTGSGLWHVQEERATPELPPEIVREGGGRLNGMFQDAEGTLYVAAQTGVLIRADAQRWSHAGSGRPVHCLTIDPQGRVWLGTSEGLMTLNPDSGYCSDFSRRGAPIREVNCITVDHQGMLWTGGPEGVHRFAGSRFPDDDARFHRSRFDTFGRADGLPGDEVYCVAELSPGLLLAGTAHGLALLESDRISPSAAPPRVAITGLRAEPGDEQYVIGAAPLTVPNWQNNITFTFRGIGFRQDPRSLRYVSWLDGFETGWSAPSREPSRSYTNLRWGDYTMKVKAVNVQGVESDRIASLEFSVGPPAWLDPWFVAGWMIVLVALAAWVLVTQRNKRRLQRAAAAATVAKSEFLAKVSHEIRTPLTVILGSTETLADPRRSPASAREALDTLRRNSKHLLGLINDLLDLSRIESGRLDVALAPASVEDVLVGVDAIMRGTAAQQGLEFAVLYETPVPERIVTDPGRLRQALINLVGNAIKFTARGWIHVRVGVQQAEGTPWLVFDVQDTGVGVPADKIDMIFEAFTQAEPFSVRRFTGTGLGLTITKSIAERLHGQVTARSRSGQGSTFSLAIDLSKAGVETLGLTTVMTSPPDLLGDRDLAAAVEPEAETAPAAPALSGHVLLAEDARDISRLMRWQLETAGARVTVVDNGSDAVELAYDGHFDAVIMDIHMPGMNGIVAIREMRERGVNVPIIVVSADSSDETCRQCADAGADGFLPKPFQREQLLAEVGRHLGPAPIPPAEQDGEPIHSELDLSSPRMAHAVVAFARTLEQRGAQLQSALHSRDLDTIARLAHQLKGAGGINGYMCISEKARQIEESVAVNDLDALGARLSDLTRFTERIFAGLRARGLTIEAETVED